MLYSYAALCLLVPTFCLVSTAVNATSMYVTEAVFEYSIQLLLTLLIIWFVKTITSDGPKCEKFEANNTRVFNTLEFERVVNEYNRL